MEREGERERDSEHQLLSVHHFALPFMNRSISPPYGFPTFETSATALCGFPTTYVRLRCFPLLPGWCWCLASASWWVWSQKRPQHSIAYSCCTGAWIKLQVFLGLVIQNWINLCKLYFWYFWIWLYKGSGYTYMAVWVGGLEVWEIRVMCKIDLKNVFFFLCVCVFCICFIFCLTNLI